MADTEDLKSSGPKGRAGSSPALGIIAVSCCYACLYRQGAVLGVYNSLSYSTPPHNLSSTDVVRPDRSHIQ
jgi:hypothetical protein